MRELNKLRLNAGLPLDLDLERMPLKEARAVPTRRSELTPKDEKTMKTRIEGVTVALRHINLAIKQLDDIPSTDFNGDIQYFIGQLEDVVSSDEGEVGLNKYLSAITTEARKFKRQENIKVRAEEEEAKRLSLEKDDMFENTETSEKTEVIEADEKTEVIETAEESENVDESMHSYSDNYANFEKDEDKPINVANGSTNDEQVMDSLPDTKNEAPNQLKTMDQQDNSPQDKSGDDLSNEMKIPASIKASLQTEITKAKAEAKKLDVRDKDASYFYKDLAKAFEDLLGHLDKGTVYDFKQAQSFAQTLMGPMLHKIPTKVWKFLTNGGETKSLKSYMTDVSKKYPITGPRNTLK